VNHYIIIFLSLMAIRRSATRVMKFQYVSFDQDKERKKWKYSGKGKIVWSLIQRHYVLSKTIAQYLMCVCAIYGA